MSLDKPISHFPILGIPVSVLTMGGLVERVIAWAQGTRPRIVLVRDVTTLVMAVKEPRYRALHGEVDAVTPDGMPLVWVGKMRGLGQMIGRVSGADLVDAMCAASLKTGQSHYFYGSQHGLARQMADNLSHKYPGLKIAGASCPPWLEIGPDFKLTDEVKAQLDVVAKSGADFIWVGLSSPKQDYFIIQAAPYVGHGVFFAVGAAFDFHSGRVKRAPRWMQENGLEWAYRLLSEPKRLWRRYLVLAPKFVWLVALESLGVRKA